ncbi:ABC transporter permease [Acidisphaera sp. L21]|jgi:cell division transport system permease protein|uniref:cell division protein FtsX n=1 Tax=Acidisphaera sp. L21 TaxID=1641851 RepID=UPI00131E0835|nr:FtsX-like permease family protein [Acidisphaera sp. L21]
MSKRSLLRPARFDDLGLRRALSDRLLPALVAAMTFLAALTLAGVMVASSVAHHWQTGAAAILTVQVPQPGTDTAGGTRLDRVTTLLRGSPGIASVRVLSSTELAELLRPWLGNATQASALPLPAVLDVRLSPGTTEPDPTLQGRLSEVAPGTFMESHGLWLQRLTTLARSLQACAAAALLLVAGVGAAVVAVAVRAGLAARRDAIDIVHGLGATDSFIAGQFANRATLLAAAGGCLGAVAALPVLLALASLASPFLDTLPSDALLPTLPMPLWISLPILPLAAAAIGWLTARVTVHRWLRRLP